LESGHLGESIYLFCALAFDFSDSPAGAFFLFFGALTCAFYIISIHAKFGKTKAQTKMVMAFVLKREAFMQRSLCQKSQLSLELE
jgi:hypothetical protein